MPATDGKCGKKPKPDPKDEKPKPRLETTPLEGQWPEESIKSERMFGAPEARLYPFLKKAIRTSAGPAKLLQVLPGTAVVVMDAAELNSWTYTIPWNHIAPVA